MDKDIYPRLNWKTNDGKNDMNMTDFCKNSVRDMYLCCTVSAVVCMVYMTMHESTVSSYGVILRSLTDSLPDYEYSIGCQCGCQ